jgi:hypothetical protein
MHMPRAIDMQGRPLTSIDDLPDPGLRWVPSRKLIVVLLIESGIVAPEQVLARYADLSHEELDSWRRSVMIFGSPALRVTKMQLYNGRRT